MKTIKMGTYRRPDAQTPYRGEPVYAEWEWLVLHEGVRATLVLSKDVIATEFYSGKNGLFEAPIPCTYEDSYVRELLAELFDSSFTFEEKCRIVPNSIGDRLFLLSADEVMKYLKSPEDRVGEIRWIDEKDGTEKCEWWINTAGAEDYMIQYVRTDGKIDKEGEANSADEMGIRPAMWITNDAPALKISKFKEDHKVYIFPRPGGPDEESIRHAIACCRYVDNAGAIPVLDPEVYRHVLRRMPDTGLPMSVYFAAGTPLEECEDLMIFTQKPMAEIKEAKKQAKLLGIPIWEMIGTRLPS